MRPGVSAVRVNGLSSVVKRTRGTMQEEVEVETGEGMLVGSAGAELNSLGRVMRDRVKSLASENDRKT